MTNYYSSKKGNKGTGAHAISNAELKKMLEKQGHLKKVKK